MSKESGNKSQVILNGGEYHEHEDRLENWLNYLTDPVNLRPGLPALTVDCFSAEYGWGSFKVFVCFDETMASLKSLRVELKCSFKSGITVFTQTDSEAIQPPSTESNYETSNPDKPREWIFNLFMNPGLEHLDVSFLNMELPDLFDHLPKLRTVRLNGSRLLRMPPSFYRMSELTDLDISNCSMTEVPFELGQLQSLRCLTFSQPCAPNVLGSLRWLTSLTCHCPAFNVPPEITRLTNLRFLNLSDVSSAPDDFLDFTALEYLYFHSAENCARFNCTKANAPALKELNTNCTAAFVNAVSNFQDLEILMMGGKPLTEPERTTLCGSLHVKTLTHLSLSGLGITDIEFCLSLPRLKWLDLSSNAIVRIPEDIVKLRDLRFLDLSNNSIVHVPAVTNSLYQTGRLFLQDNPIVNFPDREVRDEAKQKIVQKGGVHHITIDTADSFIDWLNFLTDPSNLQPSLPDLTLLINSGGRILDNVFIKVSFDRHKASLSSLNLAFNNYIKLNTNIFQDPYSQDGCRSWIFNLFQHTELKELQIPFLNTELPNEFATLTKLRNIDFSHSKLTSLPPGFCQLRALEILKLDDTPLCELPENINLLTTLASIDLRRTALTKLPAGLFFLPQLESLYLEETSISELPDSFGGLPKLKDFSLSISAGTQLPDSFFQLHALEIFRLNNNSITELSDRFDTLTCLKKVSLNVNISKLPSSFFRLNALEELNLEGAGISELSDSFEKLINLKKISLKGTKITHLPPGFFQLPALEWLDLNGSSLPEIPAELCKLRALRYLAFSQPCPQIVWSELAELTDLYCSCPDYKVPGEFSQLVKLKNLHLKSVSFAAFDAMNLPELQTLEFKRSKNYTPFNLEGLLPGLKELNTNYIEAFYPSIKTGALKGKPLKIIT